MASLLKFIEVYKKSDFFKHPLYLYIKQNSARSGYSKINTFLQIIPVIELELQFI